MTFTHAGLYSEPLFTPAGKLQTGTLVNVYVTGTTTKAALFADRDKTTAAANPVLTDSFGNLVFYVEPGIYDLTTGEFGRVTVEVAVDTADVNAADVDLAAIAALDSAQSGVIASDGAGWIRKSYAQLKTALGLGNVDNTSDAGKPVSAAQQAALDGKQASDADLTAIAALDAATAGAIASDGAGWVIKTYAQFKTALGLVKADVGLGNVDNTSDAAKPVSTAQQAALATYVPLGSVQVDVTNNPIAKLICDATEVTGCFISVGESTVHAAPGTFPSSAVGKAIAIGGAGPAGAALTTSPSGSLRTITAVAVDGSTATFDDPAHGVASTAVVAARSVTAATTRGSSIVTASDGAFTASDVGKTISVPNAYGDDCPTVLSPSASISTGTAALTSDYACFVAGHVGQYVRVSRAGPGNNPLIAKITVVTDSTHATVDTNASTSVTSARVSVLGTPRTVPVTITKVDSATQVEVRRFADFTVAATASTMPGGSVLYGTDNSDLFDTLIAGVPDNTTLFFPGFTLIAKGTHTISRPLTFTATSRDRGGIHCSASTGRLLAGANNVRFRDFGFRGFQHVIGEVDVFGNAAASSAFTGWAFDRVTSVGAALIFTRQGRVSNTGTVTATGTGHSARLRLVDVDVSAVMGSGIKLDGVDHCEVDVSVHDLGLDANSVGLKVLSGAKQTRGRVKAYLCLGDGADFFDAASPDIDVLAYMNGQHGCEIKWNSNNNYNNPERGRSRATTNWNWGIGLSASEPRVNIDVESFGNGSYGVLCADGATGTTDAAQYGTLRGEASDNGSSGWQIAGAKRFVLDNCVGNNNGGYGVYNGSAENTLIHPRAFNNFSGGVFHDATATLVKQVSGRTQDPNGQYVAAAGATFLVGIGDSVSAMRTSDATSVNGSTVLVTDSVLTTQSLPVGTYEFTALVFYDSSTAGDLKLGLSLPGSSSGEWGVTAMAAAQTSTSATVPFLAAAITSTLPMGGAGVGTTVYAKVEGTLTLTVAGAVALQYAQQTSDATNTTVHANSRIRLLRTS